MALGAGLAFLWFKPHPQVAGDAKDYLNAALGLIPGTGYVLDDLARTQILRAPWYILILAALGNIFYPPFGQEGVIWSAWVFQVILCAFNVVLTYHIVQKVSPVRWAGMMAAGLMLLYIPLTLITARLMVETEVITGLLLFVWFWIQERPSAAGFALFSALSNSWLGFWPKIIFLLGLFGVTLWLQKGLRQDSQFKARCFQLFQPLLFGGLIMQLLSVLMPHQAISPVAMWYRFDTAGFLSIQAANSMISLIADYGPETLLRYMHGQSISILQMLDWLSRNAYEVSLLLGANIFRLFVFPENIYQETLLGLSPAILVIFHRLLFFSAVLTIPLLCQDRRLWIFWLIPTIWLVYVLSHIESRYNLPAMVFIIMLAAVGWSQLIVEIRQRQVPAWKGGLLGLVVLLLSVWDRLDIVPWFLAMGFSLSKNYFAWGWAILGCLILFGLLFALWKNLCAWTLRSKVALGGLVVLGFWALWSHFNVESIATQWTVPLQPGWSVERVIRPDDSFWQPERMQTFLVLQTEPSVSPFEQDLQIQINGFPVPSISQPPPILSELKFLTGGLLSLPTIRQYRLLPLSEEVVQSIQKNDQAAIRISVSTINTKGQNPILIYGDYPASGKNYWLPSPDWGAFSMEKAQYDGDGRMQMGPLQSRGFSALKNVQTGQTNLTDLSTQPGKQSGQYRIFLYRLLPEDANNPQMPSPSFRMDQSGKLFKVFRIAY